MEGLGQTEDTVILGFMSVLGYYGRMTDDDELDTPLQLWWMNLIPPFTAMMNLYKQLLDRSRVC
jgi:hypothetical protein